MISETVFTFRYNNVDLEIVSTVKATKPCVLK